MRFLPDHADLANVFGQGHGQEQMGVRVAMGPPVGALASVYGWERVAYALTPSHASDALTTFTSSFQPARASVHARRQNSLWPP